MSARCFLLIILDPEPSGQAAVVEKEVEELSPLEDEVPKPMKKRKFIMKKKALREQFRKRREEKERSKIEKDKGKLMKAGWMSSSLQRE